MFKDNHIKETVFTKQSSRDRLSAGGLLKTLSPLLFRYISDQDNSRILPLPTISCSQTPYALQFWDWIMLCLSIDINRFILLTLNDCSSPFPPLSLPLPSLSFHARKGRNSLFPAQISSNHYSHLLQYNKLFIEAHLNDKSLEIKMIYFSFVQCHWFEF